MFDSERNISLFDNSKHAYWEDLLLSVTQIFYQFVSKQPKTFFQLIFRVSCKNLLLPGFTSYKFDPHINKQLIEFSESFYYQHSIICIFVVQWYFKFCQSINFALNDKTKIIYCQKSKRNFPGGLK